DVEVRRQPNGTTSEAMVERLVHLGFEVRADLVLHDGQRLQAQLSREDADELELAQGQIVFVRPSRTRQFADAPAVSPARSEWHSIPCLVRTGHSSRKDRYLRRLSTYWTFRAVALAGGLCLAGYTLYVWRHRRSSAGHRLAVMLAAAGWGGLAYRPGLGAAPPAPGGLLPLRDAVHRPRAPGHQTDHGRPGRGPGGHRGPAGRPGHPRPGPLLPA